MGHAGQRRRRRRDDARSGFLRPLQRRTAASDAARGRRLFVRFLLLSVTGAWPWFAVALLGAYHGVDPSMGWLFAVGLGLQDRSRKRVFAALIPIAIGHLLSVAAVVALIASAMGRGFVWLRPLGAVILIGFGIF